MSKKQGASHIRLHGVRHHNLKNFDLSLPAGKLIVVTGLSGSGKSTLAFDTLFAEGQRRYIETFSPYARQFFDRMDKPKVDRIEGIPPAIAIEQRNTVKSTRSTVGTMTELTDYMKLLWPQLATLYCRGCDEPVRKEPPGEVWEREKPVGRESRANPARKRLPSAERSGISKTGGAEILVTFDLPISEKLSFDESLALIAKQGYQRLLLDGEAKRIDELAGQPASQHSSTVLTVIQDRMTLSPENRARFVEGCEQAYHFGKGRLTLFDVGAGVAIGNPRSYSNRFHCANCDINYRETAPALFSFNHPLGACPTCRGFGRTITIDYKLAIPDPSKSLSGGAIKPWQVGHGLESQKDLTRMCKARGIRMDVPFEEMSAENQRLVIDGDPEYGKDDEHEWPRAWYGIKGYFRWLESKSYKMHVRVLLSRYRAYTTCPDCKGKRFQAESLLYKVGGLTLSDFYLLPIRRAMGFIDHLTGETPVAIETARLHDHPGRSSLPAELTEGRRVESSRVGGNGALGNRDPLRFALNEVRARLRYLNEVGLGYLTLDRSTRSLSGGETERVNLTTCLGTRLVNTLYVLDEPSVGLHSRDTDRLVTIVKRLRDLGNTVVVVEHEPAVMRAADELVDLGPGHGESGGEVIFQGSYSELLRSRDSLTGQYLSGRKVIERGARRRVDADTPRLRIENASVHNLKDLSVDIPLGRLVCLTGVSGSGKSTLARDVLLPLLEQKVGGEERPESEAEKESEESAQPSARISGYENLGAAIMVDQSGLGRTPRSNPAVYVGAFELIREVFAMSDEAKRRGLNASSFSFNSPQGQCEKCRGAGFEKIEMQFLSDVFVRCPDCDGRRYREHILEVKVKSGGATANGSGDALPGRSRLKRLGARLRPKNPEPGSASSLEWSIGDLLEGTIDEVVSFLGGISQSRSRDRALARLKLLQDVGLGYLRAGQPINTLSGGESQRLKLVSHLAETTETRADVATKRKLLFVFDEPTTGLHFDDVRVLVGVFQRLVDEGHSLLVIEHNLDLIRCADWVIDLGPEAGDEGGELVVEGTPEQVAKEERSFTGQALRSSTDTTR